MRVVGLGLAEIEENETRLVSWGWCGGVWPRAGPAPAAGGAAGLLRDLAVRQRPLQFGDARVGEVGAAVEYELLQICERFEMY